ncbi:major facilitator superfamily-domain-containing protein [Podospora aff. communis PSN243]|uniref:Major facilitator superfamily-domain-containing protein n=1 Tax=Podospora aff. communis PSN243 TaxID=3040156 RepID=A0AAV9G264_9PEZI|nr:major facilitator superfamily-domain-containing protein [Podospora aff. communis PSN243]
MASPRPSSRSRSRHASTDVEESRRRGMILDPDFHIPTFHILDIKCPIEITLTSASASDLSLPPPLVPSPDWVRGVGFWRCFIAVCIPILLSAFEGSVVSTALPTISRDLHLGPHSSWVATSFLLASIVCQPLYGQLADIWGRRHLMMIAVVIFGAGSAVAAAANDGWSLILGRVVQGLGSGGIDLFAELILCDIIPLQRRGHYVAIKAAVYALGTTVGPILGGVFAERSWRWCFGVNIPVCAMSLVLMWMWLQVSNGRKVTDEDSSSDSEKTSPMKKFCRVDFVGISLLTMAVVLILFALSSGGAAYSWVHPLILATSVVGLLGVVAFAFWERSRWCAHPIMPPYIFSNRTSAAAMAVTTIHGFLTYGFQFYLPPFFQTLMRATPTESGIFILPCSLTIVVLAALGGPLLSKFGKYKLMHIGGFITMALGTVACFSDSEDRTGKVWILFTFLFGIGSGIIVSTTLPAVLAELTDKDNAAATGSWAFLRGLGSLLGVAAPGAAFNGMVTSLLHGSHAPSEIVRKALAGGHAYEHASAAFLAEVPLEDLHKVKAIFGRSFMVIWGICTALSIAGILISLVERQVKLRTELDSDFGLKGKVEASEVSFNKGFDNV